MLGRVRRTSRMDVGLALTFVGLAYLVWSLVAGISRDIVQEMIRGSTIQARKLPFPAEWLETVFVNAGFVIDVVGVAWLAASLLLVVWSSRQRISISWSWMSALTQSLVSAVGALLVGWAAQSPNVVAVPPASTIWAQVSGVSLAVSLVAGVVVWVTFLVWLLMERARYARRGPTLSDGLRSNVYR